MATGILEGVPACFLEIVWSGILLDSIIKSGSESWRGRCDDFFSHRLVLIAKTGSESRLMVDDPVSDRYGRSVSSEGVVRDALFCTLIVFFCVLGVGTLVVLGGAGVVPIIVKDEILDREDDWDPSSTSIS